MEIENPEVVSVYGRFKEILSSVHPYDVVDEADRLFSNLRIHHDRIVVDQTNQCRNEALSNITSLTEKMKSHLQANAAPDDLCNQALYPLRANNNQIKTAETISGIDRLMQEAQEAFEIQWEEIIDQTR